MSTHPHSSVPVALALGTLLVTVAGLWRLSEDTPSEPSVVRLAQAADPLPSMHAPKLDLFDANPSTTQASAPGTFRPNPRVFAHLSTTDSFRMSLPLPDGSSAEALFQSATNRQIHGRSWVGQIEGEPGSQIAFTAKDDAFALHVFSTRHGEFDLECLPDGFHRLKSVDPTIARCTSVPPSLDLDDPAAVPSAPRDAGFGNHAPNPPPTSSPPPDAPASGDPEIDIVVLYTAAAVAQLGSVAAVETQAQNAVNSLNATFSRSGVNATATLVHTHLTDYVEAPGENVATSLTRLSTAGDGHMDEAYALRTAYGADIVSVFTVGTGFGIGTINGTFSAVEADIGSGVAPHEWGHNLGCGHDEPTGPTAPRGIYSYSLAHSFTVNGNLRGTIMSYVGQRIAYFSNPNVNFTDNGDSAPTGVGDQRDHARTINTNAPNVAARQTVDPDDFDQDGIANADEPAGDIDGDRILNERDAEADGDGINDGAEAAIGRDPFDARALFPFAAEDGWSANNVTNPVITNGAFAGTASTNDPQIARPGLHLPATGNPTVRVRMTCSIATTVQLYWGHTEADNISGTRVVTANYTTPGTPQTLTFALAADPDWMGKTLTRFRLDPVNGTSASGAAFSIDSIATTNGDFDADSLTDTIEGDADLDEDSLPNFADSDRDGDGTRDDAEIAAGRDPSDGLPSFDFDTGGDFEGWTTPKHIDGAAVSGGRLSGTLSGADSQLLRSGLSAPASAIQSIVVRSSATSSGTTQLFWRRSSDGVFAAGRSVSLAHVGSGALRYLRLPLAGVTDWNGRIQHLRLDPTNSAIGTVSVDFIRASDGDFDADTLSDDTEGDADPDGDFIPNYADPDSDNDDLPDAFEAANGLNPLSAADATLDKDLDGANNRDEFIAGTSIHDSSDRPAVASASHTGGSSFQILIPGKAGRVYTLERRTNLTSGMWTGVTSSGPLASDGTVPLTDPSPPPSRCFYRVRISLP